MPSHIVKPERDTDYYVEWSSIVDGPTFEGNRERMTAYGVRMGWASVAERLDRADATSSSALWYEPSWDEDETYMLGQSGTFPRSEMAAVVTAFLANGEDFEAPGVVALLTPFEDDSITTD